MSRSPGSSTTAASDGARLQSIPDDHLLDFLDGARRGFASSRARSCAAAAYAGAVVALELEALRRGLVRACPHERPSMAMVLRRLSQVRVTLDGGEWQEVLSRLDLRELWSVSQWVQLNMPAAEQVPALAQVCLAVDRIVYGAKIAEARQVKYVRQAPEQYRLAQVARALEFTFGQAFDRMAEEGNGS